MQFRISLDLCIETDLLTFSFKKSEETKKGKVLCQGKECHIFLPSAIDLQKEEHYDFVYKTLTRVLRNYAQKSITPIVEELANRYGYSYNKLTFKDIRTRWGSCSSKGNINLSIWLLLFDRTDVECVIKHELAHLRHLNHSADFRCELDRMLEGRSLAIERDFRQRSTEKLRQLFFSQNLEIAPRVKSTALWKGLSALFPFLPKRKA